MNVEIPMNFFRHFGYSHSMVRGCAKVVQCYFRNDDAQITLDISAGNGATLIVQERGKKAHVADAIFAGLFVTAYRELMQSEEGRAFLGLEI